MEKMVATQCSARVCAWRAHTQPRAVSVHALRAEKSAALLIFLYSHGGLGRNVGVDARGLKNRLLKKTETKRHPSLFNW